MYRILSNLCIKIIILPDISGFQELDISANVPGIPDMPVPLGLAQDLLTLFDIPSASLVTEGKWCGTPQKLSLPHLYGNIRVRRWQMVFITD